MVTFYLKGQGTCNVFSQEPMTIRFKCSSRRYCSCSSHPLPQDLILVALSPPALIAPAPGPLSSTPTIPQVAPIRVDIDRTVQRLEREVVTPGDEGQEEDEFGYHGDDILPTAAEGMGPGKYMLL